MCVTANEWVLGRPRERRQVQMVAKIIDKAKWLYADEDGATMVEYALMIALIAVVSIAIITLLGTNIRSKFTAAETATR